jgi:hypothetical protein
MNALLEQNNMTLAEFNAKCETAVCRGRTLNYLPTGDTYDKTVCRENRRFFESSLGDWIELVEASYNIVHDTVTCGWCSHPTPIQNKSWRDTVCEQCGHNVAGGN